MPRIMVPSTPATRGEIEPEVYDRQVTIEELRALADEHGFDLVEREDDGGVDENAEPPANASRARWESYARTVKGAGDGDLVGEDGKELKRDELVTKFGSAPSGA